MTADERLDDNGEHEPLTEADLRQFVNEGYVVLRKVVPESLLAADVEVDEPIAGTAPDGHSSFFT